MRSIRSVRAAVAIAVAVSALILMTPPSASAHHAPGPCDAHRMEAETVRHYSRRQIRCAVARWAVPGGLDVALCIARRESGLVPWAESADGLNKGLFQQHVHYWDGNYRAYTRRAWALPPRIISGRTNAIVSVRMAADIGWGPWGGRRCV